MTVTSSLSKISYQGNSSGSLTDLGVPFLFFSKDDLTVQRTDAQGNEKTLTDDDYVVSLPESGESSGQVKLSKTLAAGEKLTIERELSLSQEVDYTEGDKFKASSFEEGLDRLTLLIQQINKLNDSSTNNYLKTAKGSNIETTLPPVISNAFLGVNDDGTEWFFSVPDEKLIAHQNTAPNSDTHQLWYDSANHLFKYWTGQTWEAASGDVSGKANKVVPSASGNLATLDATGDLTDSGVLASSLDSEGNAGNAQPKSDQLTTLADMDTTKGHLIVGDGDALVSLPIGADGRQLTVDSTKDEGLVWGAAETHSYVKIKDWTVEELAGKKISWDHNFISIMVVGEDLTCERDNAKFYIALGRRGGNDFWGESNSYQYTKLSHLDPSHTKTIDNKITLGTKGIGNDFTEIPVAIQSLSFSMTISNMGQYGLPHFAIDASYIAAEETLQFETIKGLVRGSPSDVRPVDSVNFYWSSSYKFKPTGHIYIHGIKR
ncbi:MAG: hypothetical protein KZQ59_12255 [Candidatus Thiodiazotropha sp. (ex Lucinoma aequizonata)]|nr:hypothetical protein [Candidatus Thiodiazotropha sp. (ex Lucinoma aequizonata)]MCU7895108.1 hypothetical protein [Candidatus Thiodiazotropha sp. (ex Lucinoma aequizonata)]MCU7912671.1 hypothetical protein [Candidatus Thiodiazotropha sp. (ex Lucinoma aequizonata)]